MRRICSFSWSRRYERGSILVTSNRSIGEWGTVFGDAGVATAILDRLLHHSHVITIRGDSYRLRERRRTGLLKAPAIASSVPQYRHDLELAQMGPQAPPARRAARLVAIAAQRAGPSYGLPGQAAPPSLGATTLDRGSNSQCRKRSSSGRRLTRAVPPSDEPGHADARRPKENRPVDD